MAGSANGSGRGGPRGFPGYWVAVSPQNIAAVCIALAAWLAVLIAGLATRRVSRDQVFVGITPGLLPDRGAPATVARVPGTEWDGEAAVAFAPPRGLGPALAGVIVDGRVDSHDLTGALVDLAVRGRLRITAVPAESAPSRARRLWGRRPDPAEDRAVDWLLTRTFPAHGPHVSAWEQQLIDGLFGGRDEVRLGQLADDSMKALRAAQQGLYREVVDRGWYGRHPQQRGRLGGLPVLLGLVGGVVCIVVSADVVGILAGVAVLAASVVALSVTRGRTPRTAAGTAARIQALGFRRYLTTAEADQFRVEEALGVFTRYLPWAMVFGVATHWARIFGDLLREAPEGIRDQWLAGDLAWFDVSPAFDLAEGVHDLGWLTDSLLHSDAGDTGDGGVPDFLDLGDVVGDLTDGVGEFMGSLDVLDPIVSGCGDVGCGDVGCIDF